MRKKKSFNRIVCLCLCFLLALFPFLANAEEEHLRVSEITVFEKSDGTEIYDDATFENMSIKTYTRFNDVGDYVIYKICIENTSDEDYTIDESSVNNSSEHIKYEFSYDNDERLVASNSTTTIYLKISYEVEVDPEVFQGENYSENANISLLFKGEVGDSAYLDVNSQTNPNTNDLIIMAISLSLLAIISIIVLKNKINAKRLGMFLIVAAVSIPLFVYGAKTINMEVESAVEIKPVLLVPFGTNYTVDIEDTGISDQEEGYIVTYEGSNTIIDIYLASRNLASLADLNVKVRFLANNAFITVSGDDTQLHIIMSPHIRIVVNTHITTVDVLYDGRKLAKLNG